MMAIKQHKLEHEYEPGVPPNPIRDPQRSQSRAPGGQPPPQLQPGETRRDLDVTRVRVQRTGTGWGVTQSGLTELLAVYACWEDAVDYARGLAAGKAASIVEGEDHQGRYILRLLFRTDARGVVHVRALPLGPELPL
jgi:hypothetical protein